MRRVVKANSVDDEKLGKHIEPSIQVTYEAF